MKLFGVMAGTLIGLGALVGGVIGVLLPKISTGVSLGLVTSVLISTVRTFLLCIILHVSK